jgi:NAD(P)-dependent dehydrogenase (short-subunit alcohol dehydrogenase family)
LVSQQVAPIAVVSGGGTGMGKAIAAWLVCDGHHVIIIGRWARVLSWQSGDIDQQDLVILADNDREILGPEGALTEGVESLGLAEPVRKRCEVAVGFGLVGELFDGQRDDGVVVGVLAGVGVVGPGRDDGLRLR